jgi:flagellar biosynthesis protein FlhF
MILQKTGVLPLHTQTILDRLRAEHGDAPPASLEREMDLTRALLAKCWRKSSEIERRSVHVFVGPAGSGKTTALAKWLTRAALVEGKLARVWRLDGATANMAESLSVYCEILGAPAERSWQTAGILAEDIGFIDLPGVNWRNAAAITELGKQLEQFGSPKIHLTLNGAYDISILLAQVRAFSVLPIEDLILTHLDEETRWGKIWNLALGTKFSIRHFSTGQNIPGDFFDASAEMIFARQFPRK